MYVFANAMWLLLFLVAFAYAQNDQPRVNTAQGVVVGSRAADGDYFVFYGVHYGGDTAGENRFKAPTPAPIFSGEHNAVDNTIVCAQPSPAGLIGTENCLVLDIHTKSLTTPKPVLVWIDGEEYESTSTKSFSFSHLVDQDLLVVSIKYRLSIFGFLCLRVSDAPGNAGLKDIVLGLKWIKENIAEFGGDPDNVVLVGHGSGAAMVDLLTMSPMSQNLAHKAIVLSGSALAPWAVAYDPIGYAQRVGEKLGYRGLTGNELAKKLATTNSSLFNNVLTDPLFHNNTYLFAPCIEDDNVNDTFLIDAPINILRSGNYSDIPYLVGFTDREGTLRAKQAAVNNWLAEMRTNFGEFIPVDLAFESEENRTAVTDLIRDFYFGQEIVDMNTIENYLEYQGDTLILVPAIRATRERALKSNADIWLFHYAYRGTQNSDWAFPQIPITGARHGDILNYLFNYDLSISDTEALKGLTRRFVAFANNGAPTPPNAGTTWLPFTANRESLLRIEGGEISVNVSIYTERLNYNINSTSSNFWNPIFVTHYRPPPGPGSSANRLFSFGLVIIVTQLLNRLVN